jgi:phytoene dehydrogenase-like protein
MTVTSDRLPTDLSRRELLILMLGSTLGLEACRRPPPRPIAGAVIGGRRDLGHRILHLGDVPKSAPVKEVPTVVVGAGIAGLSAAWRLERRGESHFVVLELESRAGGTSSYGVDGVVPYPWAAHYLPLPQPHQESLCELLLEIGLVERGPFDSIVPFEQFLVRDPEERLFVQNQWVEGLAPTPLLSSEDQRQIARFSAIVQGWISWRDGRGRRAFDLPLARCSDDAEVLELDRVSAAAWLSERGLDSKPLRWMLEYACRDDYGCSLETTSAWALLFYHAARISESGKPSAPFLTWPEGNGRIVRHLERVVGDRLQRNRLVVDVLPERDRVTVTVLDAATNRFELIRAEQVILGTPSFVTRYLVRPFREHPPPHYALFSYSPWLVGNLHLRSRPRSTGFPLAWDNVVYQGASLGYVVATHQTLEDDGPTVWTYYQPMVDPDPALARYRLAAAEHAATWEAITAELGAAHPDLAEHATRLDVWHFGHAMIRPVPGFISGEARRRASRPYGRVHFAHTDLSGLPLLDEAHFHGVRAADAVVAALRST